MDFRLSEEQEAIRQMALDFARDELAPHAIDWDQQKHFPVDTLRGAAALGMAGIYVRDDVGGTGLTRLDAAIIIEALATGTPVVATPRGSVQEILEEERTGFVRGIPTDLAEALGRATELDRAACRASAETRFSAARMASDYVELFEDLLARPHPIDRAGVARPAA